jgi:HK97 family phage portal protein
MTVLARLFGVETRSDTYGPVSIPQWESNGKWQQGMVWTAYQGGAVTADASMRLSAVFACLRLLSEAICTLPLDTFMRRNGTRQPYRPRPAYLSFQPEQGSRIDYLSQVMLSLLTDGNAFVATPRDSLGVPYDLIVLDPCLVSVDRVGGETRYRIGGRPVDMPNDLMHIKGMTLPGQLRGLSPIAYARETIGLGLAAQRFGQAFFENGALPGAVISAPGTMSDPAIKRFRETWNAGHTGVANAHRIGVLTEGATLSKVSVAPNDAQFLETRAFQVPDVARIFGVPPHLIADASNSTSWGSGLQEQNLAFGQFSLRPWIERIEDAHGRLLTTHGLPDVFVKLNLDALLRASLKDRYESYAIGIENQFLLRNEARKLEDTPPLPGGDTFPEPSTRWPDPALGAPSPAPNSNGSSA